MWMEERIGKRINTERMDEAASTGAQRLGVACPYCLIMLDDGARARGDDVEVSDVAQLLVRATGVPAAGRAPGRQAACPRAG
jgi:Fe-S oxidoreductase